MKNSKEILDDELTSSAFSLNYRMQQIRKIMRIRAIKAIIAHNPAIIDLERNQEARILVVNDLGGFGGHETKEKP